MSPPQKTSSLHQEGINEYWVGNWPSHWFSTIFLWGHFIFLVVLNTLWNYLVYLFTCLLARPPLEHRLYEEEDLVTLVQSCPFCLSHHRGGSPVLPMPPDPEEKSITQVGYLEASPKGWGSFWHFSCDSFHQAGCLISHLWDLYFILFFPLSEQISQCDTGYWLAICIAVF